MSAAPAAGEGPAAGLTVRPVVIAHLSDLHLGAHSPEAVDSLLTDVTVAAPTLTIVTGDLTMRARARQFVAACRVLDQLPGPRLVVLGNHDVPLDPVRRFARPYQAYLRDPPGPLDPVLEAPGVRALGLASMPRWRWKSGRVTREQAAVVARTLGSTPPGALRLLALHHPLSPGGLATIAGRSRLFEALIDGQVDVVLAGHTHVPSTRLLDVVSAGRARQVLEVVAGTATSTRLRGVPRSWSLLHVTASTITVEERRELGSEWAAVGLRRFPRAGDVGDGGHLRSADRHAR
jgi:3',5'-cyclic AMP phosphodiesterase CpdA